MTPSRWSTILRRVTTEGPYINERMSVLVLTIAVLAGISAVGYADKSVASFSLAPLYFLPLALSALIHPLRVSLALSVLCLALHNFLSPLATTKLDAYRKRPLLSLDISSLWPS